MTDYTKSMNASASTKTMDLGLREYMLKVYNYMAAALAITGVAAFVTMSVDPITRMMFNFTPYGQVTGLTGLGWLVTLSPIGIALYFFSNAMRMDVSRARLMLWIYAGLTGMSLATLGFMYTGESLARTFFICASVFGAMSLYGYTTKRDLTSFGSFMTMGMFGLMIVMVVNMFMHSPAIYFATSFLGVAIFMGIIAWNTQKMKMTYYSVGGGEMGQRMAVVSAFSLYLDFINLFLYLLRFFGVRRDS